jgi:hypothetical protein
MLVGLPEVKVAHALAHLLVLDADESVFRKLCAQKLVAG